MDTKAYYGPGYWAAMHIDSFNAKSFEQKIVAANTIARLITTFPCFKCRKHATEYASQHPLIHPINDGDQLSLFRWVWTFHNFVNARLGKQTVSFEEAVKKWGDEAICFETGCD
tara:strand:+ start:841 stop:1182 length:342 start_codon:yes stop_codon:yes gene_type:complete